MPFLIEHITEVMIALILLVVAATAGLVAVAIARRRRRERFFRQLDELRWRYSPVIVAMLAGKLEYPRALQTLKGITGLDREFILEQLCLERRPTPEQVPILCKLCEDLGLVAVWQRRLKGELDRASLREALVHMESLVQRVGRLSFLVRAKSAENLGVIRHQPSWPLLVKALEDPHPDVQSVAVRALAGMGEPKSFLPLVEQLHAVIQKPSTHLSLRSVKSALVSFPLSQAPQLLPTLKHPHPRLRFLATDIIREMVEREAGAKEDFALDVTRFTPELAEHFLSQLSFDGNPDVRARAAPTLARLPDLRATPLLVTLLEDPQWFVRLHAVRALAQRKFLSQAGAIARRLSDSTWMVREAATRTLLGFGRVGTDQLSAYFLETDDRYSREQIADEMQRTGLIPAILMQYASVPESREAQVIERFTQMGKTSYLLEVVRRDPNGILRKKFLEDFGRHPDPQIRAWVEDLAVRGADPELKALAQASTAATTNKGVR
jgi:HEAT repeat protein